MGVKVVTEKEPQGEKDVDCRRHKFEDQFFFFSQSNFKRNKTELKCHLKDPSALAMCSRVI